METNEVLPPIERVVGLESSGEGNRNRGTYRSNRGDPAGQGRHRAVDLGNRFAVRCERRVGIEIEAGGRKEGCASPVVGVCPRAYIGSSPPITPHSSCCG